METPNTRRVIEVRQRDRRADRAAAEGRSVPRKLSDYPHVPRVYHDVARRLSSPARMGPPVCDELMALVQHLFTRGRGGRGASSRPASRPLRAEDIARAEHRPLDQIEPILDRLTDEKRLSSAAAAARRESVPVYRLLPIVPGIFEMMLVSSHARVADRVASPIHRAVRVAVRNRLFARLSAEASDAVGALSAGRQGDRRPSDGAAHRQTRSGARPVRGIRRRAIANAAWRCRLSAAAAASRWATAWSWAPGPSAASRTGRCGKSPATMPSRSSARPNRTGWSTG